MEDQGRGGVGGVSLPPANQDGAGKWREFAPGFVPPCTSFAARPWEWGAERKGQIAAQNTDARAPFWTN